MPYLLIAPAVILCFIFRVVPLLLVAGLSAFETNFITTAYVGFENYLQMFGDGEFWVSVGNTFLYVICTAPPLIFLALYVASSAMFFKERNQHLTKILVYIPSLISGVIMATIYRWIYHYDGPINWLVMKMGLERLMFFSSRWASVLPISAMMIIGGLGMPVIFFMAAMKAVPHEYFDIARLEGATSRQIRRMIVIPCIAHTVALLSIMIAAGQLQTWGEIYMLAPYPYAASMQYSIFHEGFLYGRFGPASARSVIMLIIVTVFILVQRKAQKWRM